MVGWAHTIFWFEEKAIKDLLKDGIAGECEFGLGRLY